jgi:hypothetical protein
MEPRPKFTPEIALEAARKIVDSLFAQGCLEECDDAEECAKAIAKHGRQHMDGYDIAKALDSYCYWDCDFEMAEILNNYSFTVGDLIRKAEKEWAKRNAIQPPLPVGTRIALKGGETGVIDEIYPYGAAQFCVKLDNDPRAQPPTNARRIVNFEDATAT